MYDDGTLAITGGAMALLGLSTGWWAAIGGLMVAVGAALFALRFVKRPKTR